MILPMIQFSTATTKANTMATAMRQDDEVGAAIGLVAHREVADQRRT